MLSLRGLGAAGGSAAVRGTAVARGGVGARLFAFSLPEQRSLST